MEPYEQKVYLRRSKDLPGRWVIVETRLEPLAGEELIVVAVMYEDEVSDLLGVPRRDITKERRAFRLRMEAIDE